MRLGRITLGSTKALEQNREHSTGKVERLATNPFGVSFKGNVIQADVFQSSSKSENHGLMERGKIFASAVLSGINSFNDAFKSRMNSVVSFGRKITTDMFDAIERIGSTDISVEMTKITNRIFPDRQYSVKNLSTKSVDELKMLWQDLEGLE